LGALLFILNYFKAYTWQIKEPVPTKKQFQLSKLFKNLEKGIKCTFVQMDEILFNKVSESALVTLNLEDYFPTDEVAVFDMKDYLFMGLILKEKDFREALKNLNLSVFTNKLVAVTCSADAVIPMWAYMLVASSLQPVAKEIVFSTSEELKNNLLLKNISQLSIADFADKRVVIKGCGDLPIGEAAYLEATKLLRPVVKSIMYGEPCSTVPIYKKK
jgi:Protein of unknown function (DUF2480)